MATENPNKVRTVDDDQLLEWIACWRSEGLTPLVTIKGYAELLLKGLAGELTGEQRRFVEIILRNCDRAADWFRLPAAYLTYRLERHHVHWEEICLPNFVAQVLSGIQIDNIEVDLPNDLPPIRGDQCLQTAILYLIEPDLFLTRNDACQTRIKADLAEGSSVLIQICTGVQLDFVKDGEQPSFFPGTRLSIADQISGCSIVSCRFKLLIKGLNFALPCLFGKCHQTRLT